MADYLDEDGVLTLWEKNKELASTKQDTLVSGENIRTVNGMSLLGSGNIALEGGSGGGSSEIKAAMSIDGTLEVTGSVKANDVQATMFMIPNGTSEQVLMADGSTKNISEIGGNGEDDRYSQLLGLLSESPYNIPTENVVDGEYVWDDGSDNSEGFAGLMFNHSGGGKILSYSDELGWQEDSSAWTIPNIPVATTTSGGVMSPEDKTKLDAIDPTNKSPFTHGTGTNSAVIDSDTYCEATGVSSFAMGIHAKATGEASVAMGRYVKAEGRASVAMGGAMNSAYFTGEANATEYIATNLWGQYKEDVTLLIGHDILEYRADGKNAYLATITNAEPTDTYGTARITVDKSLSEEPVSNMRYYIHYCRAVARNSVVLGGGAALGMFSAAIGVGTAANDYAAAIGYANIAAGFGSFSSGYLTKAKGDNSHTEGNRTHAIGAASHAEGQSTRAKGAASHAEGVSVYNIYFTGDGSNSTYLIQNGSNWQSVEDLSKLIGGEIIEYSNYTTVATILSYSLTDDGYTLAVTLDKSLGVLDNAQFGIVLSIASGDYSHTQNGGTKASGKCATSMGSHTVASGDSSLATGDRTFAVGENSSTHGENTHALNKNEAAFGVSNISHNGEGLDSQTLFSIGCGDNLSGMDMASRIEQRIPFPKMEDGRNAVEVMRNGDIWYGGYNTGVKIWDAVLRQSPYLTDVISGVVDTKADKTALDNYVPLVGDSTIDGNLEVGFLEAADVTTAMLHANEVYSSSKDSSGNNYSASVMGAPDNVEISTYVYAPKSNLTNTASLYTNRDYADITASSHSGAGSIYTAYMGTTPNSAEIRVDNKDKMTEIHPNSLQIKDYGADPNPQTYIDINVDGIKAPKFVKTGGTSTQILMADGNVKELSEISGGSGEDSRYTQFIDVLNDSNACPIIPTEDFFKNATWADAPEDNLATLDFFNKDAKNLHYDGEKWVEDGMAATALHIPYANNTTSGLMSAADKQKLDALGSNIGGVGVPETLNCNTTYVVVLEADDNLSVTGFVAPTTLFGNYTVHLKTSTNNSISLPSTLLWANGAQPTFEDNTCYELSITATLFDAEYVYKAVLVAFK